MIKHNKILVVVILAVFIGSVGVVRAEDYVKNASSTDLREQKQIERSEDKLSKIKTVADKKLDQRIENLEKLRDRASKFKNIADNDKNSIIAIIDDLVSKLNTLKNTIDMATSTAVVKEARDSITENYRIYMLINPEFNIIASADRVGTMISMMNIVGAKLETRINNLATSSNITSANIVSATKTLVDLKTKLVEAQTNIQEAIKIVAPLMPDQGDKTVMESNQKALKDARAKIKIAHNDLIVAKKDAEAIVKLLGREKKVEKKSERDESDNFTSSPRTTNPVRLEN
jgi:hypothetical protein